MLKTNVRLGKGRRQFFSIFKLASENHLQVSIIAKLMNRVVLSLGLSEKHVPHHLTIKHILVNFFQLLYYLTLTGMRKTWILVYSLHPTHSPKGLVWVPTLQIPFCAIHCEATSGSDPRKGYFFYQDLFCPITRLWVAYILCGS